MSRRPMTDEERADRRAWMQQAWASGRFANRRKGMHPRHWTPEQNRALASLAGTRPIDEIAVELERRFYIRRTRAGIRIQAKRLGISLWQGGLSLQEMTRLFGIDHRVIKRRWVEPGYLSGRRWQGRGPNDGWWFEQTEVERFVRECGWLIDVSRMQKGHRLTRLAETVQKSDPWIVGLDALSSLLGIAKGNVKRWIARGYVPHKRRPVGGSAGYIVVRGRDIPAIKDAIDRERARRRQASIDRFTAMRRGLTLERAS